MGDYYDRQGNPITLEEWGRLFEDHDSKIVMKTMVGDSMVSTVWLGMDHSFGGGPPMIFETMVFPEGDIAFEDYCERYETEEEALKGHARIVALVYSAYPTADELKAAEARTARIQHELESNVYKAQ